MFRNNRHLTVVLAVIVTVCAPFGVRAQTTLNEDFTGTTTVNAWQYFYGACLTASTTAGVWPSGSTTGQIPGCTTIATSYYGENLVGGYAGVAGGATQTLPDPPTHGALRFTNGYPLGYGAGGVGGDRGGIVSATPFPSNNGLAITFKTVTYRGDSMWGGDGADGIAFFLADASVPQQLGSTGGSLGYDCNNQNALDGMVGAYLGLGIDEFGNFLHSSHYVAGYTGSNPIQCATYCGDNGAYGYGHLANRIGLRGYGNVAWSWLNANYPTYYPSSFNATQQRNAVQNTCVNGLVWNSSTNAPATTGSGATIPVPDYAAIPNAYIELPSTQIIANESAISRGQGTPIVYKLTLTSNAQLSLAMSYNGGAWQKVIANQDISSSNGPMPANFWFGFTGSTGASTNIHEILCFKAEPETSAASSAGVSEKESAKLETGVQAFFAFYNPSDWTGRVTASGLGFDAYGNIVVAATPNWDASCALTGILAGQTCLTMGTAGPLAAVPTPANRVMLAWSGSAGIPFEWGNLTASQQSTIDAGDAAPINSNRLQYLRGVRTNEINAAGVGLYRARVSVLADIVDSSPTWVGPPIAPYPVHWGDRLYSAATIAENSGQSYQAFLTANQTRLNVVYVGANDGFLHGFRTGSFDVNNNFVSTYNDGQEVLAYMPGAVVQTIHSTTVAVDYAANQYGHQFYVDATPGAGDVFFGGVWHTWVVGGLGPGGAAIYALDVTNPASTNFTEANAASLVIGEWTSSTISCTNVASCGNNMGQTYGTPQLRRLHDGNWGVIFGNGIGSTSGDGGIYVMVINQSTGAKTFYYLSTSTGSSASPNGIAFVTPADLDGDHITDYVYAGDIQGNVWRFDLTSNVESNWKVTTGPLFKTAAGQPITTEIIVASGSPGSGMQQQIMLLFGTGQKFPLSNSSPATYATATQSLYGIWDWNMSAWNTLSVGGALYASLTAAATGLASPYTVTQATLQAQTVTVNSGTTTAAGNREIASNATICWASQASCASTKKFGWYLNLPGAQEQIVYSPQLAGAAFTVNSIVPASNDPLSCSNVIDAGFTYALNAMTGGAFTEVFLPPDEAVNPAYNSNPMYLDNTAIGIQTNATGSSYIIDNSAGTKYLIYETDTAAGTAGSSAANIGSGALGLNVPQNSVGHRLSWVERR